jgi:hypothetical protein
MESIYYFPIYKIEISASLNKQGITILNVSFSGEHIFGLMDNEFRARNIPWGNCLSLGCDNASVMTGQNKGMIVYHSVLLLL